MAWINSFHINSKCSVCQWNPGKIESIPLCSSQNLVWQLVAQPGLAKNTCCWELEACFSSLAITHLLDWVASSVRQGKRSNRKVHAASQHNCYTSKSLPWQIHGCEAEAEAYCPKTSKWHVCPPKCIRDFHNVNVLVTRKGASIPS